MKQDHLKAGLLLFGSYSFAVSVAKLLHELGHGIYVWLRGGAVYYNINPFGTVYGTVSGDVNLDAFIYHWGGTISATIIGLALLYVLKRQSSPYWGPVIMTGVVCVLFSGGNLLPGAIFDMIGDAGRLIALGTPRWVIFVVAVSLLILGLYTAARWLVPLTGLGAQDSLRNYILVFLLGFAPYTAMEILYGVLRQHVWLRPVLFAVLTNVVVVLIALVGKWYASWEKASWPMRYGDIKRQHVISALLAGLFSVSFFIFVV